jgi:hypothetical protein
VVCKFIARVVGFAPGVTLEGTNVTAVLGGVPVSVKLMGRV